MQNISYRGFVHLAKEFRAVVYSGPAPETFGPPQDQVDFPA